MDNAKSSLLLREPFSEEEYMFPNAFPMLPPSVPVGLSARADEAQQPRVVGNGSLLI